LDGPLEHSIAIFPNSSPAFIRSFKARHSSSVATNMCRALAVVITVPSKFGDKTEFIIILENHIPAMKNLYLKPSLK
jgi:hypothetical protein